MKHTDATKKTVLVTGANRGLGFAIARGLAGLGHFVYLGSRDRKAGEAAADSLRGQGLDVVAMELDLNVVGSMDAAMGGIGRDGGGVDVLVNNAGVLDEKAILDLTDAEIAGSVAVHLTGPLRLIRLALPNMLARGYGRIVNVSSGWGSFAEGMGGPGLYGVTKAAQNALTVRLAAELPATIKVNSMCPGWVRTRMGGQNASRTPEQAADTALWLASLPEMGPTGGFFRDRKAIQW
jgi:NAD(P)-dependent dehydrogenase (short-subunit alcohol dehydrogenase family)